MTADEIRSVRAPTRTEALAALARSLAWLQTLEDSQHRLICPDHRIEHTGKSACAAILALELFLATGVRSHLDFAVRQGRRLVARLEREGTSPCHTFRPGRHDPFNCSNSVIDGGACADALASLCLAVPGELSSDDFGAFRHAALLHTDTYLKYACRDKGIPAQRAWALTGLASAHALEPNDEWLAAAHDALDLIATVQRSDGSYPYHPLEWGAEHPGSSDVSSFYQSRVTGFSLFAAERLRMDPRAEPLRSRTVSGLDFLLSLQGPDGVKCGLVEAKPWYWGAHTEVASHPFDVHAFATGARVHDRPEWFDAARRAMGAWIDLLEPSGRPRSHRDVPGTASSYQCPLFWAAHACWAARVVGAWPNDDAPLVEEPRGSHVTWHEATSLARFETPGLVVFVRGARPPGTALHGSPAGNGIIRAVTRDGRDLVTTPRFEVALAGEWNGTCGSLSWRRGIAVGARDLRFSLWLARVAWRRGQRRDALLEPFRHVQRDVLAFASQRVSSANCRTVDAQFDGERLVLEGHLAWLDGTPVAGSRVVRSYCIEDHGVRVVDQLVSVGNASKVTWRDPPSAGGVVREGDTHSWRLG